MFHPSLIAIHFLFISQNMISLSRLLLFFSVKNKKMPQLLEQQTLFLISHSTYTVMLTAKPNAPSVSLADFRGWRL